MRRVVGAVAVIPDGEGKLRYFYRGAVLPAGLNSDAVERCIRRGLVSEVEDPAPAPDEDDDLGDEDDDLDQGDEPDDEDGDGDEPEASDQEADDDQAPEPAAEQPERPRKTAGVEAWREYRVAQGKVTKEQAAGMTKQPLIDLGV